MKKNPNAFKSLGSLVFNEEGVKKVFKICSKTSGIGPEKIKNDDGFNEFLRKLEDDNTLKDLFFQNLEKAEQDQTVAILQDRKSARARDEALRKLQNGRNLRANLMLFGAGVGFVGSVGSLVFFKDSLSTEIKAVITAAIGILGACLKDAFEFEFGGFMNRKSLFRFFKIEKK